MDWGTIFNESNFTTPVALIFFFLRFELLFNWACANSPMNKPNKRNMCCFLFKRKWVSVESSHADKGLGWILLLVRHWFCWVSCLPSYTLLKKLNKVVP
jgi:hypothetical protein